MCHRPGFSTAERSSNTKKLAFRDAQSQSNPIHNIGFSIQNHSLVKGTSQIKEEPDTAGYSQVQSGTAKCPKKVSQNFSEKVSQQVLNKTETKCVPPKVFEKVSKQSQVQPL